MIEIWIVTLETPHRTDSIPFKTKKGAMQEIRDYCIDHWGTRQNLDILGDPSNMTTTQLIDFYFTDHEYEFCNVEDWRI